MGKNHGFVQFFDKLIDGFGLFRGGFHPLCEGLDLRLKDDLDLLFKSLGKQIIRGQGKGNPCLPVFGCQHNGKIQITRVKGLLLFNVGRGEGFGVGFGDKSRLVLFVGLPEHHRNLVKGKIRGIE